MTNPVTAWWGEHLGSTQIASADFSTTGQFYGVTVGSGGVALATTQGQGGIKVLANAPKQNDPAFLWDIGEAKVIAGAAITAGQILMVNASGQFIPWVDNGTNVPVAEARMPTVTTGGVGDIITAFVFPNFAGEGTLSAAGGLTAHAGGTKAVALALTTQISQMATVATTGDSVLLPPAIAGEVVLIANDGVGNLDIYAQGSDTIDGSSASTALVVTTPKRVLLFCYTTGEWASLEGPKAT